VRLMLAGTLATLTAASLAMIRPALLTEDERTAARSIHEVRWRSDVRFLSSDLLEGRAPGTRGEELAREYVTARFEAIGIEPGAPGGAWEQPVELVGVTSHAPSELRVTRGKDALALRLSDDYVAWSNRAEPQSRIEDAEIVFVGYGIVAPEFAWDDFKGADLRGKVLLVMNNDPDRDPALFGGKRRLHYGRWDYKYEAAAAQGAAGAIVIHTNASAGYGWNVVQSSWSGEQQSLAAASGRELAVKAWATEEACRRIARLAGQDLDALRASAESRDFRPVPLGVKTSLLLRNDVARRASANVIGRLPGSDPSLAREAVLYTAHHDHYGTRPGRDGGTEIYNGALDNASGVATLLAVAEAFASLPERPRRSILFASVTAEEQGLLGSLYLSQHLPLAPGLVAANVNIDGAAIWGRTRDVSVIGLGKSSLDDWVRALAEMQGRSVVPEAYPDKGAYYRSDHLSFARIGVPSAFLEAGTDVRGRPPGWGRERRQAWEEAHYHQPSDDMTPDWDLSGAMEDAQLVFLLGLKVANAPLPPSWRPGDEFEGARKKALAELGH
jgi:Zn-dependent M28 family amino/carboxypeptidase